MFSAVGSTIANVLALYHLSGSSVCLSLHAMSGTKVCTVLVQEGVHGRLVCLTKWVRSL